MAEHSARRLKWRKRIVTALAVLIVSLALVRVLAPGIATRIITSSLKKNHGLDVTIGGLDISLLRRSLALEDVIVFNPEGFENREFLSLNRMLIDMGSFSENSLDRIEIEGLGICLEETPDGERITDLMVRREKKDSSERGKKEKRTASEDDPVHFGVESIALRDISLTFVDRKKTGNTAETTVDLEFFSGTGILYREDLADQPEISGMIDSGAFAWTWNGKEILSCESLSAEVRERSGKVELNAPAWSLLTDAKAVPATERATELMESFFEEEDESDKDEKKENDREDGDTTRKSKEEKRESFIDFLEVTLGNGAFHRSAVIEAQDLSAALTAIDATFIWRRESDHFDLTMTAGPEGVSPSLKLLTSGQGFSEGDALEYEITLSLNDFPWQLLLWPADQDRVTPENGPLVRSALVTGSVTAVTDGSGSVATGQLLYSDIDVRPDSRSLLNRISDPIRNPATWLAELADPESASTPQIVWEFESETPHLHPFLLQPMVKERFTAARLALFESQRD